MLTSMYIFYCILETNSLNAYDVGPLPAPRHSRQQGDQVDKEPPRLVFVMNALKEMEEEEDGDGDGDDDDDDGSWVDEESRLCPPALPINLEAALAELPSKVFTFSLAYRLRVSVPSWFPAIFALILL